MLEAHDHWKKKDSPLWLLLLSRSEAGNRDLNKNDLKEINQYVDQFSSKELPPFDDPDFLKRFHWRHQEFFQMLQKEAEAYHAAFRDPHLIHQDIYSAELVEQVGQVFGAASVAKFKDQPISEKVAGNMMVAIAVAAIRDMALIEYLHQHKKISGGEKKFALDEINWRMDRVGLNGVDLLFEARPELEKFVESDTTSISVEHLPNHAPGDSMTRAAYYNAEKSFQLTLPIPILTRPRQNAIGKDFGDLEDAKDRYILVHVHDLASPSVHVRKTFEGYGLMHGRSQKDDLKHVKLMEKISREMDAGSHRLRDDYVNFLLHEGIAINHPQRDNFVASLRQRINQADVIDAEVVDPSKPKRLPRKTQLLLGDGSDGEERGSHVERLSSSDRDSGIDESQDKKKEHGGTPAHGAADQGDESHVGAKIATIGGAAAVGLLLATGRDKDGKDSEDKEKQRGKALKFAALAGAAAVAVGGAIMWTKKPEFLYKPMSDLFRNLGFGRA